MTLVINTNDRTYVWRTGDDLLVLDHAISVLQQYAKELKEPATVAQTPQLPIPTKL